MKTQVPKRFKSGLPLPDREGWGGYSNISGDGGSVI